ncbi:fructosamine kinase family protein [Actinacidiphila rubida]|uniref:Streptomycin 6-kinase n=1 Tax=Actinacidiphila rubida TaxID=310780 RepID=A0A1H8TVM8_9ACTN|nr:fructosamine kinase family protein [Actinacidiphila rubida]SEO94644.1 streptomycin 6-kinase [Actinacidiphila rubida]
MTTPPLLPPPSLTCRGRLIAHYGGAAEAWLDRVPQLLTDAGRRWNLRLTGYHDAGHASVLATALDRQDRPVLVKTWFDPDRYVHETAALRLWHPGPDRVVLDTADELSAALLRMIAGRPGGHEPPSGETALVAEALQQAHGVGRDVVPGTFPSLADHLANELLPRIRERALTSLHGSRIVQIKPYLDGLAETLFRRTVLHSDLYRENVAFTRQGRPVLLDPLPMQGDALFDWAFWTIYYRLGHATEERLREAARRSGLPQARILPWCLLIGLDGLLYYEDTGDPRQERMADVLTALYRSIDWGPTP